MSEPDDPTVDYNSGDGAEPSSATRREGPSGERAEVPRGHLERGTALGRYIVLDVLGEGGMGVVYAAYDPELDRKVAIKLLQARTGDETTGGQAWLLREAQALARLSHPNVIAVHDVGTLSEDRVFLAMELVEGLTLRKWLRERERSWREVLPVMQAAGAGLAAAHAAGLVHRDFKPDNVLVGTDGRVRVMDFGLARLASAPQAEREARPDGRAGGSTAEELPARRTSDLSIERRSPLTDSLTMAGTVLGTPAYMAPEIYQGVPASARTDQFAFGVALYEALFRTRPYAKGVPRDAPPKPPPAIGVPAPLQRVAMRAIAVDPEARYPSLDALLADLAIDPFARRRQLAIAAGALAVLAILGAGVVVMSRGDKRGATCGDASKRLAGVWDRAVEQATHAAFAATKKPYAEAAFTTTSRALDRYAGAWTGMAIESCEATQTDDVRTLREDCLDQRLAELRALTGVLATADAPLVAKADGAVRDLEPIARCGNLAALRAPVRPAPEVRAQLPALTVQLAAAKAEIIAGRYAAAEKTATAALARAKELRFDPVIAQADLALGNALQGQNKNEPATAALADGTWAALRGKRDDLVATLAISAGVAASNTQGQAHDATVWVGLASAARARFGADPASELIARESEGVIAAGRGDMAGAIAAHQAALTASLALYKRADDPDMYRSEALLGATLSKAGSYADARPHLEHALALREPVVGPDHPDVALILSNLGTCYTALGDNPKARTVLIRAMQIRERLFGATSPAMIATLNNLADFLRRAGDVPTALTYIERAQAIADKVPGPDHPLTHTVATTYAEILAATGRTAEARTLYDALLANEDRVHSPMLPTTQTSFAGFVADQHDLALASTFAERAIAGFEASGGKDAGDLWQPLAILGLAKLGLGQPAIARPLLQRAIAIGEKQQLKASDLAAARAGLATIAP